MAAGKENAGLQIALIIFVMLTVILAVTTFIFFKESEDAQVAKVEADKKHQKAENDRKLRENEVTRLKQLVGKGLADPVDDIMNEFKRHQDLYGATYNDDATKVYPVIFEAQRDAYVNAQQQIVDYQAEIAKLKSAFDKDVEVARNATTQVTTDFKAQTQVIQEIRDTFTKERGGFKTKLDTFSKQVDAKQTEIVAERAASKKKEEALTKQVQEKADQLDITKKDLLDYKKFDVESPDGKVVGINQAKQTVWINLGSADGLRRQTSFSVYSYDVNNAQNAEPKGSIEVIQIRGNHLAEARITEDVASDPIVRDDKIFSSAFRPGKPERFAVVGMIDIDGDDRSDLDRVMALIRKNGGLIDAYSTEEGDRKGKMSAETKFLVLGKRPDEDTDPKMIEAYKRMLDAASKYGVKTISVSDFLGYMGYQGRERSIGLGRGADPDDFKAKPARGVPSQTFRRRRGSAAPAPQRGESGGAY